MVDEPITRDEDDELDAEFESLSKHLGSMDSEDLLRLSSELESLREHPGWISLQGLLERQARGIDRASTKGVLSSFASGRALQNQAPFLHSAGVAKGLRRPPQVIEKVSALARRVEQALGIGTED